MAIPVEEASPATRLSPFKHPDRRSRKSETQSDPSLETQFDPEPSLVGSPESVLPSGAETHWGAKDKEWDFARQNASLPVSAEKYSGFGLTLQSADPLSPLQLDASAIALLPRIPVPNSRSSGEKRWHNSEERLHLTLRSPPLLARSSEQTGLKSRLDVDPDPDWNLGDLSAELDRIVYKNGATPSPLRGGTVRGTEASGKR